MVCPLLDVDKSVKTSYPELPAQNRKIRQWGKHEYVKQCRLSIRHSKIHCSILSYNRCHISLILLDRGLEVSPHLITD